eukprot:TRINITY_DN6371_c0_g2_i1.p1 TRINITY_DN6371_c0_g2~~TRINITY_DN6371_c0_g2_i1.p1  ORF type:complete len:749 (+),score=170.84 TRINITY_DN6371_c0_g2_i1:370-2616(+)
MLRVFSNAVSPNVFNQLSHAGYGLLCSVQSRYFHQSSINLSLGVRRKEREASGYEERGDRDTRRYRLKLKRVLMMKKKKAIDLPDILTISTVANLFSLRTMDIIKWLIRMGEKPKTVNDVLTPTIAELLAMEYNYTIKPKRDSGDIMRRELTEEEIKKAPPRSAVVTVMGHIDHGKTSLLDALRKTQKVKEEAGGITQHIGAFKVRLLEDYSKTEDTQTNNNSNNNTSKSGFFGGGSTSNKPSGFFGGGNSKNNSKPEIKPQNPVKLNNVEESIVFLDTPGHAAFSTMRERGARLTDIALLIIAVDDGVQEQTIESINAATKADVPIIVVITKIDKEGDADKIVRTLLTHNIVVEEFGGKIPVVKVSARTGEGLNDLINTILIQSAFMDLKAPVDGECDAHVIESKVVTGKGYTATLIVRVGTLKMGDWFIAGRVVGRIRHMSDDTGKDITEATPSTVVEISGSDGAIMPGDDFIVVDSEEKALKIKRIREDALSVLEARKARMLSKDFVPVIATEEDIEEYDQNKKNPQPKGPEKPIVNAIIKTDVAGSIEALKGSIAALPTGEVEMKVIKGSIGPVTEEDIDLATLSNSLILAFNIRVPSKTQTILQEKGIQLIQSPIIYTIMDNVRKLLTEKVEPMTVTEQASISEVLEVFMVDAKSGETAVAGCRVIEGTIKKNARVRVLREEVVVHDGVIESLRQFKSNVMESKKGTECGIILQGFDGYKKGDKLQTYIVKKVPRSLEGKPLY